MKPTFINVSAPFRIALSEYEYELVNPHIKHTNTNRLHVCGFVIAWDISRMMYNANNVIVELTAIDWDSKINVFILMIWRLAAKVQFLCSYGGELSSFSSEQVFVSHPNVHSVYKWAVMRVTFRPSGVVCDYWKTWTMRKSLSRPLMGTYRCGYFVFDVGNRQPSTYTHARSTQTYVLRARERASFKCHSTGLTSYSRVCLCVSVRLRVGRFSWCSTQYASVFLLGISIGPWNMRITANWK